ncbi:murein DD-endopeptidase MepM/ murein hydrolase activator NlpD [Terracoccus luteus]|uniref:Murein DD-endopeptidase MepM/ murein hydrolase activator NlpD n=1 Tax=Terracoccus luteus TaxID=53356 RepID=A0A495XVP5_9MICO|nr:M23 family metallopeptidase [Terracoccus luteus]RKT78327.1 murein DD-endopeptidase MepM/ murein hydrolase activator NlpD [Terracoccus luteus]
MSHRVTDRSYTGRHRPVTPASPSSSSRGRRLVVPIALVATTVAGGLVIRQAGAATLGAEAAGGTAVVAGQSPDAARVAAAAGDRGAGASRDTARSALAALSSAGTAAGDEADEAATAAAAAAKKEAAAKAAAQAAAKKAAEKKARKEAADKAAAARAAQARAARAAEAKARQNSHRWVPPVSGYNLTSGYGFRWGKMHPAQDLAVGVGSKVRALSSGTVVFAGWDSTGYGNLVRIQYWDGTVSYMAHNSRLLVSVGESVEPGQLVAYSGNTGNSTGPHVHLEIHPDGGGAVAPRAWLAARGVNL